MAAVNFRCKDSSRFLISHPWPRIYRLSILSLGSQHITLKSRTMCWRGERRMLELNLGGRAQQRTTTLYSLIKTLMINDNIYTPSLWKPLISKKRIYTEPQRYIHNPSLQFNDGADCFSQKFVGCGYGYACPLQWCSYSPLFIRRTDREPIIRAAAAECCCYMAAVRLCDVYTYIYILPTETSVSIHLKARQKEKRQRLSAWWIWSVQPQELWEVSWRALFIYRPITRI